MDWEGKLTEANFEFRVWEEFKLKAPQTLMKAYEMSVNWTNKLISHLLPYYPLEAHILQKIIIDS